MGEYQQAQALFIQSFAIAVQVGDVEGQHVVCRGMGSCYCSLEQYAMAVQWFETIPGGNARARAWCKHHLGDHERAVELSREYHAFSTTSQVFRGPIDSGDRVYSTLQLGVVLLYQVDAQFTLEEEGVTQTSDATAAQLLKAVCLLAEVVEMPESFSYYCYKTDALLDLACLEFRLAHENLFPNATTRSATSKLRIYLDLLLSKARKVCGGCEQSHDDDVEMLTCRCVRRKNIHICIPFYVHVYMCIYINMYIY